MIKPILNFFLSLRTAIWLLLVVLLFLFAGTFVMPREEFGTINAQPFFAWMVKNPAGATWWLWGSLGLLALLSANTLLCSLESVIRKRTGRQWLLIVSPQVIHMGFLFIMLAHIIDASASFRGNLVVHEGMEYQLPDGLTLRVNSLDMEIGPQGYPTGWRADVEYLSNGAAIRRDSLGPNRPSFYQGLGIYLKDLRPYPKAALFEISREPGAKWALVGAIFFMAGTVALMLLKIRRER